MSRRMTSLDRLAAFVTVVFVAVSETESETSTALVLCTEEVAHLSVSTCMFRKYACALVVCVLCA